MSTAAELKSTGHRAHNPGDKVAQIRTGYIAQGSTDSSRLQQYDGRIGSPAQDAGPSGCILREEELIAGGEACEG